MVLAALLVGEDGVSFLEIFEAGFGLVVGGVFVGVPEEGELSIRGLDFFGRGGRIYCEQLVAVADAREGI